jgi:hypothetical protein
MAQVGGILEAMGPGTGARRRSRARRTEKCESLANEAVEAPRRLLDVCFGEANQPSQLMHSAVRIGASAVRCSADVAAAA